jgi:hypothetical protein
MLFGGRSVAKAVHYDGPVKFGRAGSGPNGTRLATWREGIEVE